MILLILKIINYANKMHFHRIYPNSVLRELFNYYSEFECQYT